ncbi:MAG: excinuclease ABC subunit UvrA, partial [Planctomycetota bacterium]
GYLTLDRSTESLAGGEAQRIRLATQIGNRLVGVLYVLDEPTIGMHQRDVERLLGSLLELRDHGNSLVVIEHDAQTIEAADHVIDLGPGAGEGGGEIVASGSPRQIRRDPASLTGRYLGGREEIPVPARRRPGDGGAIVVRGASEHNLKEIDAAFPTGALTAVTGVSGSGKSTLVMEILARGLARRLHGGRRWPGRHRAIEGIEDIDAVGVIDQSPLGRTPAANAATYTGLFTPVRELFARLPVARARGYRPGRFSFNVAEGRCPHCEGKGSLRIEMHFLSDVWVTCDVCRGRRYDEETLKVRYRGRTIGDILDMEISEAASFFENHPRIRGMLRILDDVGLGYLALGQPATTLSGGEAQRVKLAAELGKPSRGRKVTILDEPTTGLHFADVKKLIEILHRLVDRGDTVIVIEHHLDVVMSADHVIDLGPEGGDEGGRIIVAGTPEKVARCKQSHTGRFLAERLRTRASGSRLRE